MVSVTERRRPVAESNLRSFFFDALREAIGHQHIEADDGTVWYLTNLLTDYSRADRVFDWSGPRRTLRPVAELYGAALEAASEAERKLLLRRLGDLALFVSGLFSGFFGRRRRLVDVDYYVAMGGAAYSYLWENAQWTSSERALREVFQQLASEFSRYVDVLAEVGESSLQIDDRDVLRIYEVWRKTGSRRLEHKLRRLGISPTGSTRAH